MLGSHCRVLEGFVQLFLHALVLNHLVQLCLTMIFNVAIGCLNGLACQQRSALIRTLSPCHMVCFIAGQTSAHCSERSWLHAAAKVMS